MRLDRSLNQKAQLLAAGLYDLFRDTDGNVWILAGDTSKAKNYFYIKVCAEDTTIEEVLSTAQIEWDNSRNSQYPESVLCAADGRIYFGPPTNGIYILRDGHISHIGWQQGLMLNNTDWVYQSADGTTWFASRTTGIAVYDPNGIPADTLRSKFQYTWQDFALANRCTVKDFQNNLWCSLEDKPRTISKWNGRDWEHFELEVDPTNLMSLFVDNLNRVHFHVTEYAAGAYRISGTKVDRFADIDQMLVDSVRTGAKKFRAARSGYMLAPLVTKDNKIWYSHYHSGSLYHYDGTQWHRFNFGDNDVMNISLSKDGSIVIASRTDFYTMDKGQFVKIKDQDVTDKKYLLGEDGLRPFDEAVYAANKATLFPARKINDQIYLFENIDRFLNFSPGNIGDSVLKLPRYSEEIWPHCIATIRG
jgi:hypothetical protein